MRLRIIEAAVEETEEKGIKFTMSDLAKRLGVSKRTLYENFSSKEALIDAIVERFFEKMKEREEHIINNKNLSDLEKLKELVMILPNSPKLMYISRFYDMKQYYPKQWKKVEKWVNEWTPEVSLIKEGKEKGHLREVNAIVLRKMVIESMMSLIQRPFLMKNNMTLKETLEAMADILLHGIVSEK